MSESNYKSMLAKQVSFAFAYFHMQLHFYKLLDYKKGFGGDFGIDATKKDQSALGWDHREQVQPHESQTG
jgi:hypothetical protein